MQRVKLLRILMLLTLVIFSGVVITSYRTGKTISDSTADEDLRKLVDGEKVIQKEFSQKNYQKEQLESEIRAREMVNYQDGGIILEDFHFTRGADGMDVRSDFGRHDQESGDSFLWDNVIISDGQGMTIRTAAALHHTELDEQGRESSMVVSDSLVEFFDPRLSGSSHGVIYDIETRELQLPAQVDLTIHNSEGSVDEPVSVRAGFLKLIKESGIAYLARGVRLEQDRLSLSSRTLRIEFDEANRRIRHVSAFGDVVLELAEGNGAEEVEPGEEGQGLDSLGSDPGRKTLRASQLEIFFDQEADETARLQYLVARGSVAEKAVIRVFPAPGEGATGSELRQLEGQRLIFRFRPDGPANRLDSFHAEGGCLLRMADGGPEEARLSGETLTARFDGQAQELEAAEVAGGILFSRGEDRIRGRQATFDAAKGLLHISGEENGRLPRMWNDKVQMEAVHLTYSVDGQLLVAEQDVWVKVEGEGGEETGLDVALFSQGSGNEPVYIHADRLESDLEAGVSSFRGTVRVLNGENVLSARNLWLHHEDRRMEALESVLLVIHPPARGEEARVADEAEEVLPAVEQLAEGLSSGEVAPLGRIADDLGPAEESATEPEALDMSAPLQITCRELVYDDLARYIILNDKVTVRKHRTRLAADHMEVQLARADNRILHIIASAAAAKTLDPVPPELAGQDLLVTGFDRQASRQRGTETVAAGIDDRTAAPGSSSPSAGAESGAKSLSGGGAEQETAGPSRRPQVPQVTLSQPGGRTATGERVLYYPGEQVAVLVGIDTIATIVDPRSGSAQGTSLTYYLADGKILNRANDNEVTLILLHSGAPPPVIAGGGDAANGVSRGGSARSSGTAGSGSVGRSSTR